MFFCATGRASYPPSVYEVPVPRELRQHAYFELKNAYQTERSKRVYLSYDLPTELIGIDGFSVLMKGFADKRGVLRLSGKYGDAICGENERGHYLCRVTYKNLPIDSQGVRRSLAGSSRNAAEFERRLAVSRIFQGEPIGFVHYTR